MEKQATILTLFLAIAACALIGLLTFINARVRRQEIGILRAIGTSTRQIMALFVGKAVLLGLIGAVVGCAAGFAMGFRSSASLAPEVNLDLQVAELFSPGLFAIAVVATVALTALASWIPAVLAAAEDPAVVLCEE